MSINIGLAILIITALAMIFSTLASFKLNKAFPKGSPNPQTVIATPVVVTDLNHYSLSLEKALFGPATAGKLVPFVDTKAEKIEQLQPALGDLLLLGTVMGSFRESFALIQKNSTKEERVFRMGDTVFEIGPLVSVKSDTAQILAGGKRVTILTPMAVAAGASIPVPTTRPPETKNSGLATQVGAGNYVIDQRALNAALDNIGQAMTDARLLPSVKDGKVEGFRASEVKPQGIFGMIGMKNGDVLLRINDFPIDSPEKAIQSFATLKGQSRIKLDLIRDGQATTFNYDIR
jgi:general secretion pathway protein C